MIGQRAHRIRPAQRWSAAGIRYLLRVGGQWALNPVSPMSIGVLGAPDSRQKRGSDDRPAASAVSSATGSKPQSP